MPAYLTADVAARQQTTFFRTALRATSLADDSLSYFFLRRRQTTNSPRQRSSSLSAWTYDWRYWPTTPILHWCDSVCKRFAAEMHRAMFVERWRALHRCVHAGECVALKHIQSARLRVFIFSAQCRRVVQEISDLRAKSCGVVNRRRVTSGR
jgi:hypothetical protein